MSRVGLNGGLQELGWTRSEVSGSGSRMAMAAAGDEHSEAGLNEARHEYEARRLEGENNDSFEGNRHPR